MRSLRWVAVALPVALFAGVLSVSLGQDSPRYKNLQVLPADISRRDLADIMLENQRGLGLPRRQGEGCLYCHVGDMEVPRGEWDYASDAKPEKLRARAMMRMTREINEKHLAAIEDRVAPALEVTCDTCHAGRTDPRSLTEILTPLYRDEGVDAVIAEYRSLRERYLGAPAYDFRPDLLDGMSTDVSDLGAFDDALKLAAFNAELHPDEPSVRTNWLRIQLERTLEQRGVAAALLEFESFQATETADVVSYGLLDWMGWRVWRKERKDDATVIFERNRAEFPDVYFPHESMASVLQDRGDLEGAIGIYQSWLAAHPDHAMARRQLTHLEARRR